MKHSKDSATAYAKLVAEAEEAVAGVKDPELRSVAFAKVLDDLLQGTSGKAKPLPHRVGTTKKPSAGAKASKARKRGPKAYVSGLVDDGYFGTPHSIGDVKSELGNRGHHIPLTTLSGPLQSLCQEHRLRRHKKKIGKKTLYVYSNW